MKQTEQELLVEALVHLEKTRQHAKHDLSDALVQDAVLRLVAMLDALGRLSEITREHCFGDDWPAMRGMRNRIVHGYMTVDPEVIRLTVRNDLVEIERRVKAVLGEFPTP